MDKEDTRPIQRERGTREMVKEVRYTGRLVRRKGYIKIRVRIKDASGVGELHHQEKIH